MVGIFGRIWNGIKKGWGRVRDFVGRVIKPVYQVAKPIISAVVPGGSTITSIADAALPIISNNPDVKDAAKEGAMRLVEHLKK